LDVEVQQRVVVGEEGRITVVLPEALPGDVLNLTISYEKPRRIPRRAGSLKGKIHLGPEFDDPIPGLDDYQ